MANQVSFNIHLKVDGKDAVKTASVNVGELQNALDAARNASEKFTDSLIGMNQHVEKFRKLAQPRKYTENNGTTEGYIQQHHGGHERDMSNAALAQVQSSAEAQSQTKQNDDESSLQGEETVADEVKDFVDNIEFDRMIDEDGSIIPVDVEKPEQGHTYYKTGQTGQGNSARYNIAEFDANMNYVGTHRMTASDVVLNDPMSVDEKKEQLRSSAVSEYLQSINEHQQERQDTEHQDDNVTKEEGLQKPGQAKDNKSEHQNSQIRFSDEIDENGRQFVLTSDGKLAFGNIGKDTGLPAAPILLSEGIITNTETNDGYGLAHIEARHGDQIRKAGFKSVVDFVEKVAKNYDVIKQGIVRDGHQTYRLQLTDKHNNTLMIELSGDGTYWTVNTAGIFKTSYGKNNKEVYNRHTTAKQPVETVETSQDVEQSDTQTSSSMNVPTTSDGKISEKSDINQENVQFSAEKKQSAKVDTTPAETNNTDSEVLDKVEEGHEGVTDWFMPKAMRKDIEKIAKKLGYNVQWLYTNDKSNGFFVGNTVYLSLNAERPYQFVFGHEMTHAIKSQHPQLYKRLMDAAKAIYADDEEFQKRVEDTTELYRSRMGGYFTTDAEGNKVEDMDAYTEEVVADTMGEAIFNAGLMRDIAFNLEHPTLAAIRDAITNILQHLTGKNLKNAVDSLSVITDVYNQAYEEHKQGKTGEETEIPESDAAYSIRQKPAPKETKKGEAKQLNQENGGTWAPREGGELTAEGLKQMGVDKEG